MLRVTVEWSGTGQGQPWFSTHHFEGSLAPDASSAVAALATFWGAVDAVISTSITWQIHEEVELVDAINGDLAGIFNTAGASGTGGSVATPAPWASQALIRWRTGSFVDGREVRGRTFVPGLTINAISGGGLVVANQTTIDNAADALIADANSVLAVWQRPRPARVDPPLEQRDGSLHPVVTASVWTEFATLRSRRD